MSNSRRNFLKKSIGLAALGAAAPDLWFRSAFANARGTGGAQRTLVVIQLGGGNDGLNTVIPYTAGPYFDARPTLAIPAAQVLKIESTVGLHPGMAALVPLYEAGKLAIVQGAGYP